MLRPLAITVSLSLAVLMMAGLLVWQHTHTEPIRVGVLHSQTGATASSEYPVLQATLAAIDDLNRQGGVLGRPVVAVLGDGASDAQQFAQETKRLLLKEDVSVIFGGWSSADRKAMLTVMSDLNKGLLFYPLPYEGMEKTDHIIYMGSVPNQQLYPAVAWATEHLGQRFSIIGSDHLFPRLAAHIATQLIDSLEGKVCTPLFLDRHEPQQQAIITQHLQACQPEVILNLLNGDDNQALFQALAHYPEALPVMSLSVTEIELAALNKQIGARAYTDHYATWDYFQSIKHPQNQRLHAALEKAFATASLVNTSPSKPSQPLTINSYMSASWDAVHLWANAVNLSETTDLNTVQRNLLGMSIPSASGVVSIDKNNQHTWKRVYIGQANAQGQFDIQWTSQLPVKANPWPRFESQETWQAIIEHWYQHWGNQWQAD